MAETLYRAAAEAEIPATVELFLTALRDLYERHGFTDIQLPERAFVEQMYRYIRRTGIFHVAEIEGQVVAICHAVVRDQIWFLSGFWTMPGRQQQKIGMPLLKRVWAEGVRAGAHTFFTWSSIDVAALASYMKMGMLPGYQIFTFAGTPTVSSEPRQRIVEVEALAPADAALLDARARAARREMDHRFWLTEAGYTGRQWRRGESGVIGYYYFNNGVIGPAVWRDEEDAAALLGAACREAAEHSGQVRLMIPGINHAAIRFALQAGLRLTGYSHLLTTASFGRMEQYLPSGPLLF